MVFCSPRIVSRISSDVCDFRPTFRTCFPANKSNCADCWVLIRNHRTSVRLAIQFKNKNSAELWEPPSWHANPFQMKQPIQCFHLGAWLFLASSSVTVLLTWFKSPQFILDALMPMVIGVGLMIGVHLSRLIYRSKFKHV